MNKFYFIGTGVAVVTPFNNDGSIDFDSLGLLIDFLVENKVDYLVAMGTTGETPVLKKEEKYAISDFFSKKLKGKIPWVIGIGGNSTAQVIEEMKADFVKDAVAILSASPYYNKPSQEGIYQHYKAIADAAPLPIIIYNVPGRTGKNMEAETTLRLATHPNIIGIKEASGDLNQCAKILKDKPEDFFVVSGDDNLAMQQIQSGMQGVISVAANAFPLSFSNMVRAALNKNFDEANELNNKLIEGYDIMFCENNPAGIKAFLTEMGLIKNNLRLPLVPLSEPNYAKVKSYLSSSHLKN